MFKPIALPACRRRWRCDNIWLFAGIRLLAMWALVGAAVISLRAAALDKAQSEASNLSAAFEEQVRHVMLEVSGAMNLLEQRLKVEGPNFDLLKWAPVIPEIAAATMQVSIVGTDGRLIASTVDPHAHAKGIDLSDREYIRIHLDNPNVGIFIGKPVLGRVSHKVTIQISKRLTRADGSFAGVLVFSVAPRLLTSLHEKIDLGDHGVITLVGDDRVIRARFTKAGGNTTDPQVGIRLQAPHIFKAAASGNAGGYEASSSIDHVARIFSWRRVAGYPLIVLVGIGRADALAAAGRFAVVIVAMACLLTVVLGNVSVRLHAETRRRAENEAALAAERMKLESANHRLEVDIALRREGEERLHAAQETLRDAVDSISEAFVIFDKDDRMVMCNEAYRALYSASADKLVPGVSFEEILRNGLAKKVFLDAIGREEEWLADRMRVHKDPSHPIEAPLSGQRWALICERRMRDGGIAGLRVDITALKQTETRLRAALAHLDQVQRVAGIGSTTMNLTTGFLEWSSGACTLFGIDADTIEPAVEFFRRFVHPEDKEKVRAAAEQAALDGVPAPPLEYRIVRPDGMVRTVYRENAVEHDARGRPVGRIVTFKDITELKATEAQLRASNQHLAQAQRISGVGSIVHDFRTGERKCSDQLRVIFGIDDESFQPTIEAVLGFVHPDDRAAAQSAIQVAQAGVPATPREYRFIRPSGEVRVVYTEMEIIRDEAGRPFQRLTTFKDITELRAAQERERELYRQLMHSQKLEALGTLAGGIAHDLNNTLVPILALAKLALDDLAEDNPVREDIATIMRAGERARDLVKQILAYSRKQDLLKQEVDLAAVAREALPMLRASLPATIRIDEAIEPVPRLFGNAGELHQVIVNLVTNAAQAIGPAMGVISISVAMADGGIRLAVADTGCGMDAATVERIFEPFFTTKGVGEGTGLGLSVVHGIVKAHGGRIEVSSIPGKGTTFAIHLPVAEAASIEIEAVAA
jgi:PAS domain S-box-containing protein